MMKLKHLLALAAVAVGSSAWAQTSWTDKTDLINNPSFEKGDVIADLTTSSWSTSGVEGWTIFPESASNSQVGIGNASSKIQGIAASSNAAVGEKYFYTRNNWNANVTFGVSQTIDAVNLPAGLYMLTCKIKTSSSAPDKSKWTLSIQEGDKAAITNTNPGSAAEWLNCGVIINKESDDTNLTISATLLPGAAAGSQHYVMMLDDFKLMYLSNADIANLSEENPLDVSGVIYNAGIYNANKANMPRGWTAFKSTRGNTNFTEGTGDTQLEGWSGGNLEIDYYQQIAGLPEGKYRMTAYCHDSNLRGAYAYIYNDRTQKKGVADMTRDYSDITTRAIDVANGDKVNIGIEASIFGGSWVTGDNFRLEYCGISDDLSEAIEEVKTIANSARELLDKVMKATVKSNLESAIELAEALDVETATKESITITSNYLTEKIEQANASIEAYENLKNAIDNIVLYTPLEVNKESYNAKVEAAKTAAQEGYSNRTADNSASDVLAQALQSAKETANIADFNYANDTYTEKMAVNWENTNQKGQHWNGTDTGYYDTWSGTATEVSKSATVTLAPGNYILKAAGRGQAGTTTYIKVGDVQVNFTNKGDAGKGIDTDGNANFSDGTFANGAGRGWEWRFIEFTLEEKTEVTLTCGYDLNAGTWASVCVPELYADEASMAANELSNAKNELLVEIGKVDVPTTNIGDAAFQYPTADIEAIETAIEKANEVAENAETLAEVNAARAAIAAIEIPALNAPAAGQKFHLNLKDRGTVTFIQNPAAQSGYGIPFISKESDNYAQAFALIPVESEENDMYIMSFEDYDGETRYICNGIHYGAGTGAFGIRTITDKDKALVIKVVATAEEGVYNLMNTSTDGGYKKLGSNGGDFYTDDKFSNFTISEAQEATATLAISDAKYGTFIAPFDADIPEDVTVYTCEEIKDNKLTLKVADAIKANTAYIVSAESEVKTELKGWGLATKDAYETGVLTGSYVKASVEVGEYLLQNNGKVGFYLVAEEGLYIGANRCYLTAPETTKEGKAFYFDNATAIEAVNALATGNVKTIYNAAGAAQKNLVRGLNIVKTADGKTVKVMVK